MVLTQSMHFVGLSFDYEYLNKQNLPISTSTCQHIFFSEMQRHRDFDFARPINIDHKRSKSVYFTN